MENVLTLCDSSNILSFKTSYTCFLNTDIMLNKLRHAPQWPANWCMQCGRFLMSLRRKRMGWTRRVFVIISVLVIETIVKMITYQIIMITYHITNKVSLRIT